MALLEISDCRKRTNIMKLWPFGKQVQELTKELH